MVKIAIEEMLKKLDGMYEREEDIIKQTKALKMEYDQIQQDKEMLQLLIMHQSNKEELFGKYKKLKRGYE